MAVLLNNVQLTPQLCHLFHVKQNWTTANNSSCWCLPLLQKVPTDHNLQNLETKTMSARVKRFAENIHGAHKL